MLGFLLAVKMSNVRRNAAFKIKNVGLRIFFVAFIDNNNFYAFSKIGLLAQVIQNCFPIKFGGFGKSFRIGLKGNNGAVIFGLARLFNFVLRFSIGIFLYKNSAIAMHFGFHPSREGIYHGHSHTM